MSIAASSLTPGDELADTVAALLEQLGENLDREGLLETPNRVAESLRYLTAGYAANPSTIVGDALFAVQDYDDRVVGLSKLPRLVDAYSHRLQLQERMTREIADAINTVVTPRGVGVVVEGRHLCIEMRGVEKESSQTVTSCMLGVFRSDQRTRAEFLSHIQQSH